MIPETFHFLRPLWLWALVPVAGLLGLVARGGQRQTAWRRIVDHHLLRHLMVTGGGSGRRWSLGALAAGWIVATFALAGPTWERLPQPTYDSTEATVLALDLSRAMAATDVSPSRLARARFKLHDALDRLTGAQVGLVVYAEEAYVVSPLTDDTGVITEMIPILGHELMPGRGNRADRAIDEARKLLEQAEVPAGHVMLVTSSPGDDAKATRDAAERLAESGHRLSVLGIGAPDTAGGTAAGTPAAAGFDVDGLRTLAAAGAGRFATLSAGGADVEQILDDGGPGVDRMIATDLRESDTSADVWSDAGVWLVAALLPMAALAFRRSLIAVFLLTVLMHWGAGAADAAVWEDLWARRDQQAARARADGRHAEAADLFTEPGWKAAARYESGAFDEAVRSYRDLPGLDNQYNLGNALARSGDLEGAIAAYDDVLAERDDHQDARFNRDLVQQLLDQQREEEQQEDQQTGGDGEQAQQSQTQAGEDQDASEQDDDKSGERADSGDSAEDAPQQAGAESAGNESENEAQAESSPIDGEDEGERDQAEQASAENTNETEANEDAGSTEGANGPAEEQAAGEADDTEAPSLAERIRDAMDSLSMTNEPDERLAPPGEPPPSGTSERPMTEDDQRREQVLRRIPDDPGGLLREKIRRRYLERQLAREKGATSW